jgi:hypothetical protein
VGNPDALSDAERRAEERRVREKVVKDLNSDGEDTTTFASGAQFQDSELR